VVTFTSSINLYQFTANDRGQQDVVWGLINSWISRHPGERVILIGDMDGSTLGGRHNYAHPMEKNLVEADVRLAKFCADSMGTISSPTEHTWKQGDKRAKLDHGISWNLHLASPRAVFNDVVHQRFDHAILSFSLTAEEFSKKPQPARKQLAPTDRIDAVFFQNHLRAWQDAVQDKMLPASEENDGDTHMAMQRADQEVMKDEVLELQLREAKARRRAKKRQPGHNKEQTAVRHKHSFLAAAYVDAVDHKDGERTTYATDRAFEHMGLRSMSDGARRVIRGIPRWAEALRSEIKKHRDLLTKLKEKQHNNDSRKKASAQQFIFEFGIKGVRRVLNKHSKVTAMSEVYWECPIGFRWAWSEDTPPADIMKTQDVLSSLRLQEQMIKTGEKYTLVIDSEGIAVSTETPTHMAGLLDWATSFQGDPQLQQPSLILSTGPWRDGNLIAAAESFFQTNAYHPFATCARGHTGPVPMSRKEAAPADGKDTSPRRTPGV